MKTEMKVQHTPGPWTAEPQDLGGEVPCWKVYSSEGQEVATVGRWNGVGDEQNARLIAGAPELLEALKRARPHIGVGYSAIQRHQIMSMVDAAIAKAEGR